MNILILGGLFACGVLSISGAFVLALREESSHKKAVADPTVTVSVEERHQQQDMKALEAPAIRVEQLQELLAELRVLQRDSSAFKARLQNLTERIARDEQPALQLLHLGDYTREGEETENEEEQAVSAY